MNEILKAWQKIKSITRLAVTGKVAPDLSGTDEEHIKKQVYECVFAKGGEVSSRSRAVELGKVYLHLSREGREKFMRILAKDFDIQYQQVNEAINKLRNSTNDDAGRIQAEMALAGALIPPRVRLLRQFNALPNGFKFLIDFREELLSMRGDGPHLNKLDADVKDILSSWFDIGLLDLKEITWQSPASLLEKLIKYEGVHAIHSWADLKNRLDSDRHCYAFFHSKIADEPLIFVEVALVSEMSASIQELLDVEASKIKPEDADTAIFYSISKTRRGLKGIHLGNFLIKRVVEELSDKSKGLKHFATLSPVPRFREWLDPLLLKGDVSLLAPGAVKTLAAIAPGRNAALGLLDVLGSDWSKDPSMTKALKPILMRLCAYYLLCVKRGERAFDPVANFHLSNGARIERLNWLGDTSPKGMKQSAGIMVNYYYKLSEIEKNHELYISEAQINAAKDVEKWLKKS